MVKKNKKITGGLFGSIIKNLIIRFKAFRKIYKYLSTNKKFDHFNKLDFQTRESILKNIRKLIRENGIITPDEIDKIYTSKISTTNEESDKTNSNIVKANHHLFDYLMKNNRLVHFSKLEKKDQDKITNDIIDHINKSENNGRINNDHIDNIYMNVSTPSHLTYEQMRDLLKIHGKLSQLHETFNKPENKALLPHIGKITEVRKLVENHLHR